MPEKKTDVSSCSLRRYLESVSRRNIYKFLKFSMELSVGEPKSTNHLKKLICCFFFDVVTVVTVDLLNPLTEVIA